MKVTRMLSVGAVVLTLTAVTGCRASTRVALDGGMVRADDGKNVQICVPTLRAGYATFVPIFLDNQSGRNATISGVSLPKSSPLAVLDWWVIPMAKLANAQGVGGPWMKPPNAPENVPAGAQAAVAVKVKSVDPSGIATWADGLDVHYRTSRGSRSVTAGVVMSVVPAGGRC